MEKELQGILATLKQLTTKVEQLIADSKPIPGSIACVMPIKMVATPSKPICCVKAHFDWAAQQHFCVDHNPEPVTRWTGD